MTDETTNSTPAKPLTMNLLAAHVSIDAPHYKQSRFYNFPTDFDKLFPTPVSHADNYPRHLSALSPAAYFVDLMRLLEKHIPNNNLKDRRPDLWELPLDPERPDELIPFLEIVNNVLATRLTNDATQNLDGLTEEQKQKARKKTARNLLATATYPYELPVHMPLLEIRAYLAHFDVQLADVYEILQQPLGGNTWVAETLGLSPFEFKALTTSKVTNPAEAYGLVTGASLDNLHEVPTFLLQTGLTPNELAELLSVTGLSLVSESDPKHKNKKQPPQRIDPLDESKWDYLNRMIRLSRRLGWSFSDLALVLPAFPRKAGWDKSLRELAQVKSLCEKYKLPVDVLRSLLGAMNTVPGFAAEGKPAKDSLFDWVFNTPPFYHPPEAKYSKYHPRGAGGFADSKTEVLVWNSKDDPSAAPLQAKKQRGIRTSLLAALRVSNDDLQAIVDHLCSDDTEKPLDPNNIKLDVPTLTRFYRLSKMAQVLGVKVEEYLLLLDCINRDGEPKLKSPEVPSLDYLRKVGYWAEWLKESGLSAYQLDYLTTGTLSDEARRRFDSGPTDEKLAALLPGQKPEDQAELTINQLAEAFQQDPRLVSSALDYLKINLGSVGDKEKKTGRQGGVGEKVTKTDRQDLKLLLYLAKALKLTADVFDAVLKNTSLFSATSSSNRRFSIETLRGVRAFSDLVKAFGKHGSAGETTAAQLATFAWDPAGGNSSELSKLSGWEESQLKSIQTRLAQMGVPGVNHKGGVNGVSGLRVMQRCFDLAAKLGVDIQTLIRLCPALPGDDKRKDATLRFDDYSAAALSLLGVMKSKYTTDEWEKVFRPIRNRLNERERDALAALLLQILRQTHPDKKLDSLQDLSAFLLIDVEMGGCTKASYILEAISCLQTYIERCRMQLEDDIKPASGKIPDSLWSWMGHYRIWEANRKVFFYPENYIEPSQRQNATPLFRELQSELLQGDVTDEAVTDAYINYFDKLDELASLQIVDAHVATVMNPKTADKEETLFVIGRTSSEPPVFYLRNAVLDESKQQYRGWTPWEKIELTIPAQEVTALYALHRLYIFWIETKEKKEKKEGQAQKTTEKTATVKYSYQKVSGRWLQAQTYSSSNGIKNLTAVWNNGNDDIPPPYSPYSLLGKPAENLEVAEWSIRPSIRNPFKNLALGKSATQSSTVTLSRSGLRAEANRVVDGDTDGDFNAGSVSHTENSANAWWQVDLGASAIVNSIVIWNRTDDPSQGVPDRLNDYWVFVSDTPFKDSDTPATLSGRPLVWGNHQTAAPAPATTIPVGGYKGRYVRVQLTGENWLHLAEVQVMGIYGETNLALGKSATQSSTGFGGEANRAVDGNPDGDFNAGSVSHTENSANAWWQVDLGASAIVNSIVIWNRTDDPTLADVRRRLNDYWVFVSDTPFNDSDTPTTLSGRPGTWSNQQASFPNPAANIQAGGVKGRYVRVQLTGTNWLHLAEVQVLGIFLNGLHGLMRIMPDGQDELLVRSLDPGVTLHLEYTYQRLTTQAVHQLREQFMRGGLEGLLSIFTQRMCLSLPGESPVAVLPEPFQNFQEKNLPQPLDFDAGDPYAIYYREIFFHIPFLIADTLNKNQRFEDARKWYHYILDPTRPLDNSKDENGMWRFLPFRGHTIDKVTAVLSDEAYHDELAEDAFDPDAIAQTRLGAYEKAVAMKYLDNLLGWGDMLFAQDSWEAINQATLLYVQALNLLGSKPKPQRLSLPPAVVPKIQIGKSNELLLHEHRLKGFTSTAHSAYTEPFGNLPRFFNLPENDEFAGYWNRTQDCLYKIRHCMNLAGVVRQLALFEAPIDPRQLILARAAGEDLDRAAAPLTVPHYRFSVMLQQAKNLTMTVIQLGSALLTALEKKDAEDLNLLRSTQEQAILNLMRSIKEREIEDGAKHLESLAHSLDGAKYRQEHFSSLIDGGYSDAEKANLTLDALALALQTSAAPLKGVSIGGHLIPTIFGLADGGMKPGDALMVAGQLAESAAMASQQGAGMAATIAQLERRREDWELQQSLATYDVQQIQAELDGATIRQAIMERDLEIHDKTTEQAQARDDFYRRKFGTRDLYQWMAGRLSTLYFQTYKLALDVARSAETAYQYERNTGASMITSGYWDSLKKGLLAGEGLMLALDQIEKAYMDGHGRELEIEKTISLLQLDATELSNLKQKGSCTFHFLEERFNADFKDHYCRKIKSVAITIPAVVGPYQNIHATLTQTRNRVLLQPDDAGRAFLLSGKSNDSKAPTTVRSDWRTQQQIAISRGVDDSGMFQLDFRDERYLPFEGTGAVSDWELTMPLDSNSSDLINSISDVIIHLRYTALDGSDGFQDQVTKSQ